MSLQETSTDRSVYSGAYGGSVSSMRRRATGVAAGLRVSDMMLRSPRTHGASTTVADLRAFFADDHVHIALVIDDNGCLLTSVERADLVGADSSDSATAY